MRKEAGPKPRYIKGARVYNFGCVPFSGYQYQGVQLKAHRYWVAPNAVRAERRSIYSRTGWVPTFCGRHT